MARVMVFGTFDQLHPGHRAYFRQAIRFGTELVAIVARDENARKFKGRSPMQSERTRVRRVRTALKEMGIAGRAALGDLNNRWLVIRKYKPSVICLGYDQQIDLAQLKSEIGRFRLFCKIKRMKSFHPEKYKSSYFRKR